MKQLTKISRLSVPIPQRPQQTSSFNTQASTSTQSRSKINPQSKTNLEPNARTNPNPEPHLRDNPSPHLPNPLTSIPQLGANIRLQSYNAHLHCHSRAHDPVKCCLCLQTRQLSHCANAVGQAKQSSAQGLRNIILKLKQDNKLLVKLNRQYQQKQSQLQKFIKSVSPQELTLTLEAKIRQELQRKYCYDMTLLRQNNTALEQELASKTQELSHMASEFTESTLTLTKLQSQNAEMKSKIENEEDIIRSFQGLVQGLQEELNDLRLALTKERVHLQEKECLLQELKEGVKQLDYTCNGLRHQLEACMRSKAKSESLNQNIQSALNASICDEMNWKVTANTLRSMLDEMHVDVAILQNRQALQLEKCLRTQECLELIQLENIRLHQHLRSSSALL